MKKKIAKYLLVLAGCQLLAMLACWVFFSLWQVEAQNCYGNPVYSWWNLFRVFLR